MMCLEFDFWLSVAILVLVEVLGQKTYHNHAISKGKRL